MPGTSNDRRIRPTGRGRIAFVAAALTGMATLALTLSRADRPPVDLVAVPSAVVHDPSAVAFIPHSRTDAPRPPDQPTDGGLPALLMFLNDFATDLREAPTEADVTYSNLVADAGQLDVPDEVPGDAGPIEKTEGRAAGPLIDAAVTPVDSMPQPAVAPTLPVEP